MEKRQSYIECKQQENSNKPLIPCLKKPIDYVPQQSTVISLLKLLLAMENWWLIMKDRVCIPPLKKTSKHTISLELF
jgi:hypothetical protein